MYKTSELVFDIIKAAAVLAVVTRAWVVKWREKHPYPAEKMIETDAEIIQIRYSKSFPSHADKQTAMILARFLRENGKPVNAELSSLPLRKQLELHAPELQEGAKVRVRYRKHFPYSFQFADPHYASREVSGAPRGTARFGWVGLIAVTLAGLLYLAICAAVWWLKFHE